MALYGEVFFKKNHYVVSCTSRSLKIQYNSLLFFFISDIQKQLSKMVSFQWVMATHNISIVCVAFEGS